jgi:site-specific DNA recombinase
LAHAIQNNGREASYRCKGLAGDARRRRGRACQARQVATERLDAVVWDDLVRLLTEPAGLDDALRRARQGWLSGDERAARLRDVRRRHAHVRQQVQRLLDAYVAEALTLEELRTRRAALEQRLAELGREEQQLAAAGVQQEHLQTLAAHAEAFRATVNAGLEHASAEQRRTVVELLVDRVVVDAPAVEIRYVIPLSGLAQRKGVLRPRHRRRLRG